MTGECRRSVVAPVTHRALEGLLVVMGLHVDLEVVTAKIEFYDKLEKTNLQNVFISMCSFLGRGGVIASDYF